MTTATALDTASSWHASRVQQMLTATQRLPADMQQLFNTLYVRGLPDAEACSELHISPEVFSASKTSMLRCLKMAAA